MTTENSTEPLPTTTPTTIPTLEEQVQSVKEKLLQEFETLSKSLNNLEHQIKDKKTDAIPPKQTIDVEPKLQENQCVECIDCKEMLIQGLISFIEKIIRFLVAFFSQIMQMLPIVFIFYRITSLITPSKLISPIISSPNKPIII